ncbi:uncharacterized protein Tco025E_08317 [Trypanosoma conorhini]|uniref:PSP1 C-terminal domain-containing protein n=1 Tax=Trypanosoma conorhini TaxID=83891 RepID=A0A3R7MHY7_9TRYP|nr:uncharacterized protein Tco025E_08317 [Trypanosoma conorhini]RNF02818.1 hypothetical protein Tco025E_08317 [Trypanosoma conorhini]
MPVISTYIAASMTKPWKEQRGEAGVGESYRCCCRCHCHQGEEQRPSQGGQGRPTRVGCPAHVPAPRTRRARSGSEVQMAPFRSFNGKAYTVPFSMLQELNEALECAERESTLADGNKCHASLNFPGVVWRHDPYSARVLAAPPTTSEGLNSVVRGRDLLAWELMCEENVEEQRENLGIMADGGFPLGAYNHAAWNPMCVLHPTATPLGTLLCFPAMGASCSPGASSAFAPPYDSTPLTRYPFTEPYAATVASAAVEDVGGERLEAQQGAAAAPLLPSARPRPAAAGSRIIVRPFPPPSSSESNANASNASPSKAVTTNVAGPGEEGVHAGSQNNSTPLRNHRSRPPRPGNTGHDEEAKSEELLPTLSIFRSLPPLFNDLAAHANRRPSRAGKRCDSDSPLRADEVRYVYLVGHRCRRTLCAASTQYAVGELVLLEGDMGIEMGTVQVVLSVEEFEQLESAELARRGFPTDHDAVTAAFILRHATEEETTHYTHTLRELAKDLLEFLQHRINPAGFLDCRVEHMVFLDCEFQADCKKIYVYYKTRRRVLFRELAQYLHSFYHCRIWLHEVGKGVFTVSGDSSQDAENP